MILTFAHHAYDHCRQLWIWFWSMTMTESSYDYNCDNLILTNDIWLGQKISKKSYRSQPPPIPRTSLGNGTCPLARTVRLRPRLSSPPINICPFWGALPPIFWAKHGKTTRIFFHVSEALKDKNNHHNHPGPAWVCFALLPLVSWAQGRRNWEATGTLGWKA